MESESTAQILAANRSAATARLCAQTPSGMTERHLRPRCRNGRMEYSLHALTFD